MTDWIIDCQGLSKIFRDHAALVDCHLKVPANRIIGLLGPNGAGKTTLLRTLLGYQSPTSGSASVCGFDCVRESLQIRSQVAYLPGEARLFRMMTGTGVLRIFGGLSPHTDFERSLLIAQRLDLNLRRRVMFMSTGMRQKLALAIVLGSNAPLVVLDEPTANLDPNVRSEVIAMVREIRDQGRTVLMSSHIFSDIEDTCDEVVILRAGKLVHQQTLQSLSELHIAFGQWQGARELPTENPPPFLKSVSWIDDATKPVVSSPGNEHVQKSENAQRPEMVQLHLTGPAETWLAWLSSLPIANIRIERASVSSIYQQYHG